MVIVDFKFSDDLFLQCCARYRQGGRRRWVAWLLRLIGGGTCFYFGVHCWQKRQWGYLVFFAFAVLFFVFFGLFMNAIARSQHRCSSYRDEEVHMEFSDEGMEVKSPTTDVRCRWSAFTSAVEFEDGLLLFRGPLFHWINRSIVTSEGGIAELRELVQQHVPDYSVCAPLQGPDGSARPGISCNSDAEV